MFDSYIVSMHYICSINDYCSLDYESTFFQDPSVVKLETFLKDKVASLIPI